MKSYTLLERILFFPTALNFNTLKKHLEGKTILITGASSGIGEQVAYMLAAINVRLILVARREDKLLAMKQDIEKQAAEVIIFSVDLRNQGENEALLESLHDLSNGLDIIVSNAGHSIRRSIYHSLDRFHDYKRTMAINYFAPVQLLLSLIPLIERTQGQIINVSAVMLYPLPKWAAYQASKSAFDVWFRSVSPELNAAGIATSSIYFPLVKTQMIKPTISYQNAPAMKPEHAAKVICKIMYTKRKVYKPWWLTSLQIASMIFSRLIEKVMLNKLGKQRKSKS